MEKDLTPIYGYLASFKAEPQEDLEAYKAMLERNELKFRQCVTECIISEQSKVIPMVKEDLEEVISFNTAKWKPSNDRDRQYQKQCDYVAVKAKEALDYIKKMESRYIGYPSNDTLSTSVVKASSEERDVLSGTDGLAAYLGCSHNTAFNIIKSRKLPKNVQYMTGRVWKFNRKRLDEYLASHPEALGDVQ